MSYESDVLKEIRYLAELMRRDCRGALWRVEQLSSKFEEGKSLNTRSTAVELTRTREELQRTLEGIERLEKYSEQELGGQ
jgi:ribosomal protein S2